MAEGRALTAKQAAKRLGGDRAVVYAELKSVPRRLRGFKRDGSSLWMIPEDALQEYLDLIEAEYGGAR
jgi:hypothetical protein